MFIAMNRFRVAIGSEDAFENIWRTVAVEHHASSALQITPDPRPRQQPAA